MFTAIRLIEAEAYRALREARIIGMIHVERDVKQPKDQFDWPLPPYIEDSFIIAWQREGETSNFGTHRAQVNNSGACMLVLGHYDIPSREDALADMLERARVKAPADEPVKDPSLPENYRADNLIGNVIGVIADRTGEEIKAITDRISSEWGDGDFDTAEQILWDSKFGPVCDYVMDGAGIEWPNG